MDSGRQLFISWRKTCWKQTTLCSVQNKIPLIFSVDIYQRSAIFISPYLKRKTKKEARMGIGHLNECFDLHFINFVFEILCYILLNLQIQCTSFK